MQDDLMALADMVPPMAKIALARWRGHEMTWSAIVELLDKPGLGFRTVVKPLLDRQLLRESLSLKMYWETGQIRHRRYALTRLGKQVRTAIKRAARASQSGVTGL